MKHKLTRIPGVAGSAQYRDDRSLLSSIALALTLLAASSVALPKIRVSVTASDDTARESPAVDGEFLVRRVSGPDSSARIDYELSGTASPGDDYASLPGHVTLPAGETEVSIRVEVTGDDERFEGDETVVLKLLESKGDDDEKPDDQDITVTGGPATVTIIDSPHSVTVLRGSHASEDSTSRGRFDISLDGRNDSGDPLRVEYSLAGSATEGSDYEPLDGVARIPEGSDSTSIDVTPLDDGEAEEDEMVEIRLTGTSSDRVDVGDPSTASLTIEDNETADAGSGGSGSGGGGGDDGGQPPSGKDTDADLVPDAIEAEQGSNPYDADSFLDSDGGGTADYIESIVFAEHGVASTGLQNPDDDRQDTDGDGLPDRLEISIASAADSSDAPTVNGAGDDSGNGITNAVAAYLNSVGVQTVDPFGDFDRDGYPDAAEVAFGLNPLRSTAKDGDNDGVPDTVELLAGVSIDGTTDSDGDGIPDAREVANGWITIDANSPVANGALDDDGDGVSNAIEHALQVLTGGTAHDGNSDGDADGISDADEIRFGRDPQRKEQPVAWIELVQSGMGPVRAVAPGPGEVTARAVVGGHQDRLSYDWSGTDNAILAVASGTRTGKTFTFSPATLPADIYNLVLRVKRTIGDSSSAESVVAASVSVLADATEADLLDADHDGIPDADDGRDGRSGFANTLPAQSSAFLNASPGVRLQLGTTARTARKTSAQVTLEDVTGAADSVGSNVGDFDFLGGLYDFEVTNLPEPGASVQVVIPQGTSIGEFPEYRKLKPTSGWSRFTEDDRNSIASAPGAPDACPPPGDDSYAPGLTPGHFCLQLEIEDGGPNDGDAIPEPNGIVKDPGGVGTPRTEVVAGKGGGAFGPAALVLVLGWLAVRPRRKVAMTAMLMLAGLLTWLPPVARADAFIGAGAGISNLEPETAGTNFTSTDSQDFGYKVFGGFDLTPISRKLSLEAFWADLGQATLGERGKVDYSLYGVGAMFGLASRRAPRFSGFVKAGVARLEIEANVPFRQEDETSIFMGIAGTYAITRHVFLQLEYNYFTKDAQFLGLSLMKRFRMDGGSNVRTMPLPQD